MNGNKAYVGICKCGGLVAATMKDHPNDAAETVADLIRNGFDVQQMEVEAVRSARWCNNKGECKARKDSK